MKWVNIGKSMNVYSLLRDLYWFVQKNANKSEDQKLSQNSSKTCKKVAKLKFREIKLPTQIAKLLLAKFNSHPK